MPWNITISHTKGRKKYLRNQRHNPRDQPRFVQSALGDLLCAHRTTCGGSIIAVGAYRSAVKAYAIVISMCPEKTRSPQLYVPAAPACRGGA